MSVTIKCDCEVCDHAAVCIYRTEYLNALNELKNVEFYGSENTKNGKISITRLIDFKMLEAIHLECKFYRKKSKAKATQS